MPCKDDHLVSTDSACCIRHVEHDEWIGPSVVEVDRENRSVCAIMVPAVESEDKFAVPTAGCTDESDYCSLSNTYWCYLPCKSP